MAKQEDLEIHSGFFLLVGFCRSNQVPLRSFGRRKKSGLIGEHHGEETEELQKPHQGLKAQHLAAERSLREGGSTTHGPLEPPAPL